MKLCATPRARLVMTAYCSYILIRLGEDVNDGCETRKPCYQSCRDRLPRHYDKRRVTTEALVSECHCIFQIEKAYHFKKYV
jgi:hypothetical protein